MTVFITMEKSTGKGDLSGATEASSLALSTTTTSKERARTNGTTADATRETGRTTKWMDMAFSLGLTAEDMKESIGET